MQNQEKESVQTECLSTSQSYEKLFRSSRVLKTKMLPCLLGRDEVFLPVIKKLEQKNMKSMQNESISVSVLNR